MYEEFFGLQRRPFSATPDANCFVPLETHQGVLDALAVSCERGQGIGVLTGEAGLGKSLVGLRLAFELQPTFATAFLGHSAYATRRALLQAILFELNRPYDRKGEQELRLELTAALKSLRPEKQGFVLIVDEAHRLSVPLLDEVRLLTLLADGGEPLARVVLIGNRDLEERLADPDLTAFNQRVGCQVDLAPLTQAESLEYLIANLEFAGGEVEEIFTEDALTFLAKAADGVPRCLNHLADHSLLLAFVTERRPVSIEIVREALHDLKQLPLQWNDPISGGEIYRGLSQRPPMEDSAVDLWPQHADAAKTEEEPRENSSWNESAFGESSAAIEIGGELDDPATQPPEVEVASAEQFTCLKEDWQAIARQSSVEELLEDVAELAESLDDGMRPLGQTFAARNFEFGAPSPQSFAVEEFAGACDVSDNDPDNEFRDESVSDQWSFSNDDDAQPVWNLPERSWSSNDNAEIEFEEEPVIDRYVRIENGTGSEGVTWNRHTPHTRAATKRTVTAVKTTRLAMAIAGLSDEPEGTPESPESHPSLPREVESTGGDSGIVESYSRKPRSMMGQASHPTAPQHDEAVRNTDGQVEKLPHEEPKRGWHLPTELLKATSEDDGIEEQIGVDVLDMYLDVQQSLIDRQIASERLTNSLDRANADEVPPMLERLEPTSRSDEEIETPAPAAATQPDAIQRAYGRLFSELRRRKR